MEIDNAANGLSVLKYFIESNKDKILYIIELLELTVNGEINKGRELLKDKLPFEKTYSRLLQWSHFLD